MSQRQPSYHTDDSDEWCNPELVCSSKTKTMSIFQTKETDLYSYEDIEHYKVYAQIFQMTPYVLGPDATMPSEKSNVLMIKAKDVTIDTIDLGDSLFLKPKEDKMAEEIQGMLADQGSIIFHVDRNTAILEGRTTDTWMPEVFYELSRKMPSTMIYVLDSSIVDIEYKEEQGGYFKFYDNRGMVRSTFYGGRRGTAEDFVYRKAFESTVEDLELKMKQLMKENEDLKKRAV